MNRPFTSPKQKNSAAFSIVEIIIVVTVISILAAITIVSYGQWRERVAETEVKSDLAGVQAAMEDYRNFRNEYPVFPFGTVFNGAEGTGEIFTQSEGVALTYTEGDNAGYCIDAQSKSNPSVRFYYNSNENSVLPGDCSGLPEVIAMQPCSSTITLDSGQGNWGRLHYVKGKIYSTQYFKSGSSSNYRELWRYDGEPTLVHEGGGWNVFGTRGEVIYGLSHDGKSIWSYDGTTASLVVSVPSGVSRWNGPVLADDGSIYMSAGYTQVWRYSNGNLEQLVGSGGARWYRMMVASDGTVYGTTSGYNANLWRYKNGLVEMVDSAASWSYPKMGPDGAIYSTSGIGEDNPLWKYSESSGVEQLSSTGGWSNLTFDTETGAIYGAYNHGWDSNSSLWKYESGVTTKIHSGMSWGGLTLDSQRGILYGTNSNGSRLHQFKDGHVTEVAKNVRTSIQNILLAPDGSLYISDGGSPWATGSFTLRRYKPAC